MPTSLNHLKNHRELGDRAFIIISPLLYHRLLPQWKLYVFEQTASGLDNALDSVAYWRILGYQFIL